MDGFSRTHRFFGEGQVAWKVRFGSNVVADAALGVDSWCCRWFDADGWRLTERERAHRGAVGCYC